MMMMMIKENLVGTSQRLLKSSQEQKSFQGHIGKMGQTNVKDG